MPVMDNKKIPSAEQIKQMYKKLEQNEQERKQFEENLNKLINGDKKLASSPILIGKTPESLIVCGADKKSDLTIKKKVIDKCMRPELHNSLIVLTEIKDSKDRNIVVAVDLEQEENFRTVNSIRSLYGRDNLADFIDKNMRAGKIIAANEEKADKLLHSIGKSYPKENSIISFDDSIAYTTANVKYPSNAITAEKQAESSKIQEYKFTNTALAATADKLKEKIATLEDKNTALSAKISKNEKKIEKRQAKIEDAQKTKAYCKTLLETTALPQPLAAFFQSMEKRNADKAERLSEKIKTTQSKNKELSAKIKKNTVKIEKNNKKIDTLEKVDKFLNNMHTKDGRKENFITGLQEFRTASLEKKQLKSLKLDNKIAAAELSLTKLTSAVDKVKLRNKIAKYENSKDKLNSRIKKLEDMKSKLDNIANISDSNADKVISAASENITSALNENKDINPNTVVDTVLTKTDETLDEIDRIIDQSIDDINRSFEKEKDNPLKNAEISLEDNYNNIDGVINNISSKDIEKQLLDDIESNIINYGEITFETAEKIKAAGYVFENNELKKQLPEKQKSVKGILSRKTIQNNAKIIHNKPSEKSAPAQNKNQAIE